MPKRSLSESRLYLCVDSRSREGDLPAFLDAVLSNGVDIVQLREKGLEARDELAALEVFADACDRHGALLAVNDRADIAFAAAADVLHLGQRDLPVRLARRLISAHVAIGRSSHDEAQAYEASVEDGVDYFCVGPCWPTPTKPGRPAAGLGAVRYASTLETDRPWFAIGGIDSTRLDEVMDAGATRVVVVRAITQAADPGAAAAEFASRLRARQPG